MEATPLRSVPHLRRSAEKMTCPRDLQTPLLELLYWTMLEVRGQSKDERYCFTLADHAHNIPHLVEKFSPELLFYYWECERPCFLSELERLGHEPPGGMRLQWQAIEPIYESHPCGNSQSPRDSYRARIGIARGHTIGRRSH